MSQANSLLLSILVISYNTAELTKKTLESVLASLTLSPDLKNRTEVIVVDNHSSDTSLAEIKKLQKQFSSLQLLQNDLNLGFARANNLAAEQARGEYILLLNSDTIVIDRALEILVKGAEHYKLTIAAAQLLNPDQSPQAQGGSLPSMVTLFNHFLFLDDLPIVGRYLPSTQMTGMNFTGSGPGTESAISPLGWVGGTAMLVKKSWWNQVGGLDEKIFMYGEDVEFCYRVHQAGGKIGVIKAAQIIHLGSASSSAKHALIGEVKSYLYFFDKHKPSWQLPIIKFIMMVGIILRIVLFQLLGKTAKVGAYQATWKEIL